MSKKYLFIILTIFMLTSRAISSQPNPNMFFKKFNSNLENNKYFYIEDKKDFLVSDDYTSELVRTLVIKILPSEKKYIFSPSSFIPEQTRIIDFKILKRNNVKYTSVDILKSKNNKFLSYNFKNNLLNLEIKKTEDPLIIYLKYKKKYPSKIYSIKENFSFRKNIFRKEIKIRVSKKLSAKFQSIDLLSYKKNENLKYNIYSWNLNYLQTRFVDDFKLKIIFYNNLYDLHRIIKKEHPGNLKESIFYKKIKSFKSVDLIFDYIEKTDFNNRESDVLQDKTLKKSLFPRPLLYSFIVKKVLAEKNIESDSVIFFKNKKVFEDFKKFPFLSKNLSYGILVNKNNKQKTYYLNQINFSPEYAYSLLNRETPLTKIFTTNYKENIFKINYKIKIVNSFVMYIQLTFHGNRNYTKDIAKTISLNKQFNNIYYSPQENFIKTTTGFFLYPRGNYLIFDINKLFSELDNVIIHSVNTAKIDKFEKKISIEIPENFKFSIHPKQLDTKKMERTVKKHKNIIYMQEYFMSNDKKALFSFENEILLLKKEKSFFYNIF